MNTLPEITSDRFLSFNGETDHRYSFPVWSWMSSRGMKIFFKDGASEKTIGGKFFGELEVLRAAADHRQSLSN
jgi:hypothetical protein